MQRAAGRLPAIAKAIASSVNLLSVMIFRPGLLSHVLTV